MASLYITSPAIPARLSDECSSPQELATDLYLLNPPRGFSQSAITRLARFFHQRRLEWRQSLLALFAAALFTGAWFYLLRVSLNL